MALVHAVGEVGHGRTPGSPYAKARAPGQESSLSHREQPWLLATDRYVADTSVSLPVRQS
jgi:hypothetical protein